MKLRDSRKYQDNMNINHRERVTQDRVQCWDLVLSVLKIHILITPCEYLVYLILLRYKVSVHLQDANHRSRKTA